jgi:hypothetical protein
MSQQNDLEKNYSVACATTMRSKNRLHHAIAGELRVDPNDDQIRQVISSLVYAIEQVLSNNSVYAEDGEVQNALSCLKHNLAQQEEAYEKMRRAEIALDEIKHLSAQDWAQ